MKGIRYLGPITDLEQLAPIFVASDLFVFPGAVGLGPLQALCYDLPVIAIEARNHGPEYEYLTPENSFLLKSDTTPFAYAKSINKIFSKNEQLSNFKNQIWCTISHLTIENMAENFIFGIDSMLEI